MRVFFVAASISVTLAGCAITHPLVYISQKDGTLRGTTTAEITGEGHFNVTNGKLTCAGNYNAFLSSRTIQVLVTCNDGRKGFGVVHRNPDGQSGQGRVRMNDGSDGDFIFGNSAAAFLL